MAVLPEPSPAEFGQEASLGCSPPWHTLSHFPHNALPKNVDDIPNHE